MEIVREAPGLVVRVIYQIVEYYTSIVAIRDWFWLITFPSARCK
jgi:hypothetical protein